MSERLHVTIQELRTQLDASAELDQQDRKHLVEAIDEIQQSLDRSDVSSAGLAERFHETTERFVDAHPHLTRAAGQVADILAQMGI